MTRTGVVVVWASVLALATGCMIQTGGAAATTPSSGAPPPTATPGAANEPVTPAASGPAPGAPAGDDRAAAVNEDGMSITIPDVAGKHRAEAEAALRAAGVRGTIDIHPDPESINFAVAKVCVQTPGAGKESRPHLSVYLEYCEPPPPAPDRNPNLVGRTVEEAKRVARSKGYTGPFVVKRLPQLDPDCKPGFVCEISPDVGWQDAHVIELYVNPDTKVELP